MHNSAVQKAAIGGKKVNIGSPTKPSNGPAPAAAQSTTQPKNRGNQDEPQFLYIPVGLYTVLKLGDSLPARLPLDLAGALLGFSEYDTKRLAKADKIPCLGNPEEGCTRWVATSAVRRLAEDEGWLDEATDFCYQANRVKNGT
jgi:hypothetical protein